MQIQAYLDNVFDVGALLEDAEAKNTIMEHLEEQQEQNTQVHTPETHTQLLQPILIEICPNKVLI